jgi:hypothetical protein
VLTLYSLYYNETRTHLGLSNDEPLGRAIERSGTVIAMPVLSGLHHRYARICLNGSFKADKAVADNIVESWVCIDCKRHLKPGELPRLRYEDE